MLIVTVKILKIPAATISLLIHAKCYAYLLRRGCKDTYNDTILWLQKISLHIDMNKGQHPNHNLIVNFNEYAIKTAENLWNR